jgi:hypothetical protein
MIDNFELGFNVNNQIQTLSSKHVQNDNAYKCYNHPIMNWIHQLRFRKSIEALWILQIGMSKYLKVVKIVV